MAQMLWDGTGLRIWSRKPSNGFSWYWYWSRRELEFGVLVGDVTIAIFALIYAYFVYVVHIEFSIYIQFNILPWLFSALSNVKIICCHHIITNGNETNGIPFTVIRSSWCKPLLVQDQH